MLRKPMLLPLLLILASGCHKDDGVSYTGGKGGRGKILVTPRYNGQYVSTLPVFLDWRDRNGDLPPGYNDTAYCVAVSGVPVAVFDSLLPGPYFINANGLDSAHGLASYFGNKSVVLQDGETLQVTLEMSTP